MELTFRSVLELKIYSILTQYREWKSELKFYSNNYVESTTDVIFLPLIAYLGTKIQGREGDPLIN